VLASYLREPHQGETAMASALDNQTWPSAARLPQPPPPVGAYSAVVIRGDSGFVSGQFPLADGRMIAAPASPAAIDEMKRAAAMAAHNVAAQILQALGSWERFAGLCRVDGIIAAPAGFTQHARILDGASEVFVALFGPVHGAHARSAISAPSLPGNAAVELVVTFAVARDAGI
jgi:enamine deaminase RidA (YjgF/YER057c/UK114 family)